MLVVSRKYGQRLIIVGTGGERIVVEMLDRRGESQRIGITAPVEVKIWREELLEQDGTPKRDKLL